MVRTLVVVLVLNLTFAACGGNSDDQAIAELEARIAELESELASTTFAPSSATDTVTPTASTLTTTTTRPPTTTRATTTTVGGPVDVELVDFGFSDTSSSGFDWVSYGVVFNNPNEGYIATGVDVNVSWFDESGSVVGTISDTISFMLPNQATALGDTATDVTNAASMEVQFRVGDWEKVGPEGAGHFKTSDVQVRDDSYPTSVVFLVESFFADDMENPKVVAVLRDETGAIVGGGSIYVEFVPGGGSIPVKINVPGEILAETADIHVQLTWLSVS